MTLPRWGSMRNGSVCPADKWEPAISESGSSSWPTPNTMPDAPNGSGDRGNGEIRNRDSSQCLGEIAKNWPSPRAEDCEACGNHPGAKDSLNAVTKDWPTPRNNEGPTRSGKHRTLDGLAPEWPTPEARDYRSGKASPETSEKNSRPLNELALTWNTPTAADNGSQEGNTLLSQASTWQTPRANEKGQWVNQRDGSRLETLSGQAMLWDTWIQTAEEEWDPVLDLPRKPDPRDQWSTPQAHDAKGERGAGQQPTQAADHACLNRDVRDFSPPVPPPQSGETSSDITPTSNRRLNPAFVCWLMGWPFFWTQAEPMPFGRRATESWRSAVRRRLASYFRE